MRNKASPPTLERISERLSRRAVNALVNGRPAANGGRTLASRGGRLADIAVSYTPDELLEEPGVGPTTLSEISAWLQKQGLSLKA